MEMIYSFFEKIGYTHPLHPPLTHMPTGLVAGALVLAILGCRYNRTDLSLAARYSLILALIFAIPSIITGYMDWQHYYGGAWVLAIKIKIICSVLLVVLLALGLYISRKSDVCAKSFLPIYFLYFATVTVLGYFGGGLVVGAKMAKIPAEYQAGEKIYASNCVSCHPNGGNTINPSLPLVGSPQLKDADTFLAFNRNPQKPPGPKRLMPAVSEKRVTDQQMKELYLYIVNVLHPKK
ncbi:MAG: c-type cytochrome [Deltaproteobacteria bacterium]|nr:c-type cytochrome [Deltaproteobacteria bacterium]